MYQLTNKSSNGEGAKEEDSEEIIDFSVKSLFMHFNAENYISKHEINALTLMELLSWLSCTSCARTQRAKFCLWVQD